MDKQTKVIGQDKLVKNITNIFKIFMDSETIIRPHFMLTGASGSGKTLTIKTVADELDITYIEVNAAKITREGLVGDSLSSVLAPLTQVQGKPCIVFVDEFDKLIIGGTANTINTADTTNSIQNELLKVLEDKYTSVLIDNNYVNIDISNTLFVFAGAFNNEDNIDINRLLELGLKPEFVGRCGLVYNVERLSLDDMYAILENSKLLDDYMQLYADDSRQKAIDTIKIALEKDYSNNSLLGARLVNCFIHKYFIQCGNLDEEKPKQKKIKNNKKLSLNN